MPVRLPEALEAEDCEMILVLLMLTMAVLVKFWYGPEQLCPWQLLTAEVLVGWTLEVSTADTTTTTRVVFPTTFVIVDCGTPDTKDETKVETVPEAEEFIEGATD